MNSSARMIVAVAFCAILAQPFVYSMPGQKQGREEKLVAKIEREKNPGKKARLQIRLAKLKLKQAIAAYDHRNFDDGKVLLQEYLKEVRNSWSTLQSADNAVRKHVRAFMDLEISLRENDRLLEDMRRHIPYPESEGIKVIEKESSMIHNQVLEALFPDGFRRKERSKRSMPPKGAAGAKASPAG